MIDVQGHRGARGLWPENTLAGFARTLELGVSAIELDCGMTRDGVVVVAHDPELNPDCTRDAAGRFLVGSGPAIFALGYQELLAYDVGRLRPGSAYAARFPAQQALDGERIPRLADVLSLIRTRGRGRVRVAVEVKTFPERPQLTAAPEPFAHALGQTLAATDTASLVSIMAFDWSVLAAVRRLMPQVATVALTEQQPGEDTVRIGAARISPWLGGLDPGRFGGSVVRLVQATGAGTWGPDYRDLDARLIEQAHALGLRIVPWTVDEPADMERMIGLKVDGMTTDRPDVLRALLERHGLPVPPRPEEQS
ncbi:MAG TPA: glycerophosphodiester phosphodiesterase family protein [Steroidobacteraceae bacterium]|nr:glycerophosphodiester phosphodiesterase family protein [Steroidobacteraceae bacterium]